LAIFSLRDASGTVCNGGKMYIRGLLEKYPTVFFYANT